MYHTKGGRGRGQYTEPKFEDYRDSPRDYRHSPGDYRESPYGQQYERPRDVSPQRHTYDRSLDPRANPHSEVFDPKFNPMSPLPIYHHFPQPQYQAIYEGGGRDHRTEPVYSQRHCEAEAYHEKKFDHHYSNRYHQTQEEKHKQRAEQLPWQPAGGQLMPYQGDDDFLEPGQYHEIKPAGRANNYSTRITDLLTSIKDPDTKDDRLNRVMEADSMSGFRSFTRTVSDLLQSARMYWIHALYPGYGTGFDPVTVYMNAIKIRAGCFYANKGYLVLVRFRPQDLADVIVAVQESVSTLSAHDGYCIGFSEPKLMHIVMPSHQSIASDKWWDSRDDRQSRYAVACFWFKDYIHARDWFQTGSVRFKQPEFPNSSPYQAVAIPMTYPYLPDRDEITLLWSEYPSIYERYEQDFFYNYSRHENHIMKRYGGNPYVSACKFKPGDVPRLNKFGSYGYARFEAPIERVARSWRNCWITPGTYVTISTFPSMRDVSQFYYDPEYINIRKYLPRYTEPVSVAITLKKVKGTSNR